MPYKIPALAGKPYRPSNGTEGMMFQAEFCDRCKVDAKYRETQDGADGCKILLGSLVHEAKDAEYPPELTHDAEGCPTCTSFDPENAAERRAGR